MTHTEELVAALAEAIANADSCAYDADLDEVIYASPAEQSAAYVAALDPATRDKMLLGFAVEELEDVSLTYTFSRYHDHSTGIEVYDCAGAVIAHVEGPTPLAAVEAANKEVRGDR